MASWAEDARAALVAGEQLLDVAASEIADLQAELAEVQAELASCQEAAPPPPPARVPALALGMTGEPLAWAVRDFLNPGDAFPKDDGRLHIVTYKVGSAGGAAAMAEHQRRAREAVAFTGELYFGGHHEPEDNFTPASYAAFWTQLLAAVDQAEAAMGRALPVRLITILMGSTYAGGKADQWLTAQGGALTALGVDAYAWNGCRENAGYGNPAGSAKSFASLMAPAMAKAKSRGLRLAVTEFGTCALKSGAEADRAAWLEDAITELEGDPRYMAAIYFDHGMPAFRCEWTLKGQSRDVWRTRMQADR